MSQKLDQYSAASKITFSWEKKPGVSNEINTENLIQRDNEFSSNKLPPPPPCSAPRSLVHDDIQIPLPPCPFQPPYYRTNSSKKLAGLWIQDGGNDPFLAAYKECTKKSTKRNNKLTNNSSESRLWKSFSFFSCKRSSTVCDDNLVKSSHFSHTS